MKKYPTKQKSVVSVCISVYLGLTLFFGQPTTGFSTLIDIPETIRAEVPLPSPDVKSWILADFETGWILGSKDAEVQIEPASLTKLMTSYLVFEALGNGEVKMQDQVYVSEKAWKTGGSKMFIRVDTHVTIEQLIQGLIIQSGNDAAVALAEHIGGTEEGFAARMNLTASKLGMTNSNFINSSGLPAENHYSSARDMTILSIALIRRFPKLYEYYSVPEYTYNEITQGNRNLLLSRDPTVDGIKTGYTKNAGYCLIGTAKRDGIRFVATVTGSESRTARANEVQSLLKYGYGAYDGLVVYSPGDQVKSIPLWMGTQPEASIGVSKPLAIIYPKGKKDLLSAALDLPDSLEAPVSENTQAGWIEVKYDSVPVLKAPLQVNQGYGEGPWYSQLLDSLKQLIF